MKTDADYIKAGVELAEGWSIQNIDWIKAPGLDPCHMQHAHPAHIDALAAQLARQVEESGDFYVACEGGGRATVNQYSGSQQLSAVAGIDRTMNTIRAIIDSGVLE